MYEDLNARISKILKKRDYIPTHNELAKEMKINSMTLRRFREGLIGTRDKTYLTIERWVDKEEDKLEIDYKK